MKTFAVIDTNILVSSLLTNNPESPTKHIMKMVEDDRIVPLINDYIAEEYEEVLARKKFNFPKKEIEAMMNICKIKGTKCIPKRHIEDFIDLNDIAFYETYLTWEGAYLITGNLRHFPQEPRIVSPSDMVQIMNLSDNVGSDILNDVAVEYISEKNRTQLQRAWEAVERMRASAVANGIADMPMEEIDEEIRLYRKEKHLPLQD